MPTFIDRHQFAAVPSAVRQQMHVEAVQGFVDEHGVQPVGHWITDGVIYCVVRAPSQEAFCRHHADRGLPCDDLHLITDLRGSHPFPPEEAQIVRAAIADHWPADRAAV